MISKISHFRVNGGNLDAGESVVRDSSKKVDHPGLLPQQGFVLLYKFETSWALLGRLSRGLLPSQGPLILNILNSFS